MTADEILPGLVVYATLTTMGQLAIGMRVRRLELLAPPPPSKWTRMGHWFQRKLKVEPLQEKIENNQIIGDAET